MKPTVYIETTIPSYYHNTRKAAEMVVLSKWTRDWWDNYSAGYEVVTSLAVVEELSDGKHPKKQEKLALIQPLKLLPITEDVGEIVDVYIQKKIMPEDPRGDALHLALASFYKCDVLLSWNCQHIVNYHKSGQIQKINTLLGLHTPALLTPFELLRLETDYED